MAPPVTLPTTRPTRPGAAEGVSIFVSSGDESATSCDSNATHATHGIGISGWGSSPYNVSVGGTDYEDSYMKNGANYWAPTNLGNGGSAMSYIPEIPWNNSCASFMIYNYLGFGNSHGASGFCNNTVATTGSDYLDTGSGSGGPSG